MSKLFAGGAFKSSNKLLWGGIAIIALVGVYFLFMVNPAASATTDTSTNSLGTIPSDSSASPISANTTENFSESLKSELSKARYVKEVFKINRVVLDLYEKAAIFRGETLEEVTEFFYNCCGLTQESDIFAELPPVPADFAEVAYQLQTGRLYQIGALGAEYYTQPEFYFQGNLTALVNRRLAFRAWSEPQLQYWGDYGLSVYPSTQNTDVVKSTRPTFTAVMFASTPWNIQNYIGMQLIADSKSKEYFDIKISEVRTGQPYFLLEPTFPYFYRNWATKVVIEGKVKPDTPPGDYVININPTLPPSELNITWADQHPGLYATYGALFPEDGYGKLFITVSP